MEIVTDGSQAQKRKRGPSQYRRREVIAKCIYQDQWGISALVDVAPFKRIEKRFPLGTELHTIQAWQQRTRADLLEQVRERRAHRHVATDLSALPLVLTVDEMAHIYRMPTATIRREVQAQMFQPAPFASHPYRWLRNAVAEDLEQKHKQPLYQPRKQSE